jgi:hypothetical protein
VRHIIAYVGRDFKHKLLEIILFPRDIITEGSCFDAFSIIAGDTDTLFDAGLTVLAVEDDLREEIEFPVDSVRLEARLDFVFHAPIISRAQGWTKNNMLKDLCCKCLSHAMLGRARRRQIGQ